MSAKISRDEVKHVAHLARLELKEEELDTFTEQLGSVLEYAARIEALDLSEVEPMAHPLPLKNVMRPDALADCVDRDEVLNQAPASESGQFRVPPVLGDEQ